jgi:hypothetical protein
MEQSEPPQVNGEWIISQMVDADSSSDELDGVAHGVHFYKEPPASR